MKSRTISFSHLRIATNENKRDKFAIRFSREIRERERERERQARGTGKKLEGRGGRSRLEGWMRASIIKGKHRATGAWKVLCDFVRFSVNFLVPLMDHSIKHPPPSSLPPPPPPFLGYLWSTIRILRPRSPSLFARVFNPSNEAAWYNIQLHSCK